MSISYNYIGSRLGFSAQVLSPETLLVQFPQRHSRRVEAALPTRGGGERNQRVI